MINSQHKVIFLFNTSQIYDRQILKGIGYFLQKSQINWNIYISDSLRRDTVVPLNFDCDGIIANFDDPDIEELLKGQSIPIVGVGASYHDMTKYPNINYVASDNFALMESAFTHLCSKGIKQFALYSIPPSRYCRWAHEREIAFKNILHKKGYEGVIYQGIEMSLDNWQVSLDKLIEWINSLPKNTGIIAVNDSRARHVLQACNMINKKIPEECCLIGIDNEEVINYLSNISLSTIAQGTEEMGYKAANLLQKIFSKNNSPTRRMVVLPKKIIERRSTDYRSIQDPYVVQAMHFIRNNACFGIKVEQVVLDSKISRSNLELRFKQELDKTIHNIIHEEKINTAKHLLVNSSIPIQDIFLKCGFPSLQYFYFLFKKEFNVTPKEYREINSNPLFEIKDNIEIS